MIRTPSSRKRGAIAILAACLLTALMGMVAFAVDLGYIAYACTELQRTADAVSLAAAANLPDLEAATTAGIGTATSNSSTVSPSLAEGNFEFGWWNRNAGTFTVPAPANRRTNAVRVSVQRTAANGNPLSLFYGRILGTDSTDIVMSAVAFNDRGLCGAFVGIEELTASGDVITDSYDSVEGAYIAADANHHGSLCSDGPITINGGVHIKGDLRAGAGETITIHGGSSIITGNLGNRVKPLHFPSVDVSDVATHNDNPALGSALNGARNFRLNGGEVFHMPPGTYYINNFDISGMSVLNISGETVIYLTGSMTRAGGAAVNNNTQLANNLRIYSTGGDIDITSHNDFYGVIYAPDSDVDISGTADFFGAIVGQTLRIHGDATAHYDESLDLEEVDLPSRSTLVD